MCPVIAVGVIFVDPGLDSKKVVTGLALGAVAGFCGGYLYDAKDSTSTEFDVKPAAGAAIGTAVGLGAIALLLAIQKARTIPIADNLTQSRKMFKRVGDAIGRDVERVGRNIEQSKRMIFSQ